MARQKKIEKEIEKFKEKEKVYFVRILNGPFFTAQYEAEDDAIDDGLDGFEEIELDTPNDESEESSTDRIIREFKKLHGDEIVGLFDIQGYLDQRYTISDEFYGELYGDDDWYDDYAEEELIPEPKRKMIGYDEIMAAVDMVFANKEKEPEGYYPGFKNVVYFKTSEGPEDRDLFAILEALSLLSGKRAYAVLNDDLSWQVVIPDHSVYIGTTMYYGVECISMVATFSGLYEVIFFDETENDSCRVANPGIDQKVKDSLGFCYEQQLTELYREYVLEGQDIGVEERFYFPGKFFL